MFRYIKSDPNTCLMLFKAGKLKREGRGESFWYFSPTSTLVAVPMGSQDVPFMLQEVTKDFQEVSIQGQFIYQVDDARKLSELMNFTLCSNGRDYESEDPNKLEHRLVNLVRVALRAHLLDLDLRQALVSPEELMKVVKQELANSPILDSMGIQILEISIMAIKPTPETARALEASVREKMLQDADEAIYIRRNASVEQERAIKENELRTDIAVEQKKREIEETKREATRALQEKDRVIQQERLDGKIELEEKRKSLVNLSSENARKESDDKAYAVYSIMEAMAKVDNSVLEAITRAGMNPEQLISQAFRELASNAEKIGELNISPDLLQSLTQGNAHGKTKRN